MTDDASPAVPAAARAAVPDGAATAFAIAATVTTDGQVTTGSGAVLTYTPAGSVRDAAQVTTGDLVGVDDVGEQCRVIRHVSLEWPDGRRSTWVDLVGDLTHAFRSVRPHLVSV